jgi:hypothetical protein
MLDLLEAGVEALRSNRGPSFPHRDVVAPVVSAQELRAGMAAGAWSAAEIANALAVPRGTVDDWLDGKTAIPAWVPVTMRMIALLTPSARRKLQNGSAHHKTKTEPERTHPFSKIEDL